MASSSSQAQASVPLTFGQPFKAGDWLSSQGLVATDNNGASVPVQADEISSHRDGSVRFAVLSAKLSNLQGNEKRVINLFTASKTSSTPVVPADPAWNMEVVANLSGTAYTALPQEQLKQQIKDGQGRRLSGGVATEYTVVAPLKNSAGVAHPHLVARLYVRVYENGQRIRTDVVMENNRTFVAGPSNLTYSLTIKQNGSTVHTQPSFTHYHHARWHKVVWTGSAPQFNLRHNMPYFMASKMTLNYDLSLKVPESVLAADANSLANANTAPMGPAYILPYFPTTGGRSDIGPLPRWAALYLVTQDPRARASLLANADAGASVPIHYRDESTDDQPLSIDRHPQVTLRYDSSIPSVPKGSGSTIWEADQSHQPSLSYVPYLITGDAFYQDELMFWANWNLTYAPPGDIYRNFAAGLVHWEQVRGQAWMLRALGEAAHALPDNHPRKAYFNTLLANNMNWYEKQYLTGSSESPMGAIEKGDEYGKSAPWQNDFVGVVFSLLADQGVPKAQSILNHFSKLNVGRYNNEANGFCAAKGPGYYWYIRDGSNNFINSWSALYARNYSGDVGKPCSSVSFEGYPNDAAGAAAYSRGMLGAAAGSGVSGAAAAYAKWKSMTPGMDSAFTADPTWAIVPR
ncbi:hypothetical protein [Hydrogenophaga sp.]|uniref:RIFT barrel domain-containing protein n=1 Tax=Hydrogenophaga sp. TaxID=1904254 RepID=UPI00356A4EA2